MSLDLEESLIDEIVKVLNFYGAGFSDRGIQARKVLPQIVSKIYPDLAEAYKHREKMQKNARNN